VQSKTTADHVLDHIQDEEVRKLIHEACKSAGGFETWQGQSHKSFSKHSILYFENQGIESETRQKISITNGQHSQVEINWNEGPETHLITLKDNKITKQQGGLIVEVDNQVALKNSVLAAEYVMSLPFKLAEPGYQFKYEGLDTLEDGPIVHVLRSRYPSPSDQEGDTWWHFFDKDNYVHIGYLVNHLDHRSLVRNITFKFQDGIRWPTSRQSWRVDAKGQKLYLRAAYEYRSFESH
jgi:hypothetical protein